MKLIVSQLAASSGYVSREFYYVMTNLITEHNWRQIETSRLGNGSGSIRGRLLNEFGELPEAILFWEGYNFLAAHEADISRLECHKFILADDLHWWNEEMRRIKLRGFALCEKVLSTYAYAWNDFYPELSGAKKVSWVPHSASPDFMLPLNSNPENSILLSGALSRHYPLRRQMKMLHAQGAYAIAYLPHPGYHCRYDYQNNENVGRSYAETIKRHRVGFTDSLIYRYVVAKYFEIPATGALLLADAAVSGPLKELGFLENEHYIPVSKQNLEERIRYVLDEANYEELDEIRKKGHELVRKRHKTGDRARQINEICTN
jgi:hypothetical protein